MRVLLTTGIFPPDIGGPATFVPRLAGALTARGHEVTVVTLSDHPRPEADVFPFAVRRIPRGRRHALRIPHTILRIAVEARRADVVLANGLFEESAAGAALAGTQWVAKVVGDPIWERARNSGETDQTMEAYQGTARRRRMPRSAALAWALRRAGRVLTPSASLASIVRGWGVSPERIAVVPNAVESRPPVDRDAARAHLGLRGRPVVLSVGRLVPWKHVDALLRATHGLRAQVVIVGDGPERTRLEETAARLGHRTRFTGALPFEAVWEYYCAADLFVLNSTMEGLPHVALEAMAAGLPVVATATGGTPDVVVDGETGVLVPPLDESALRRAITALLDDEPRRRAFGAAGRARARAFTWDVLTERVLAILAGVVSSERSEARRSAVSPARRL